jgi:hypothetical protein
MNFDEAIEILEVSSGGGPPEARRAYLLQLQRNGPEVPPDLYERFTAAYDVLKEPCAWPNLPGDDDRVTSRIEAPRPRIRRGEKRSGIIDPNRVPQRNHAGADTRVIDPGKVPQRKSSSARSGRAGGRSRGQDARQSAPTEIVAKRPEAPKRPTVPIIKPARAAPPGEPPKAGRPDPRSAGAMPPEQRQPEAPKDGGDAFAELLADAGDPNPSSSGTGRATSSKGASGPGQQVEGGSSEGSLSDTTEIRAPKAAAKKPEPAPRPKSKARAKPKKKGKIKPLDDASLAIFSKIARTYTGIVAFPEIVRALEESPEDAIGSMAAELIASGQKVAATGLLVAAFDAMEGDATRRWIEVRGCLEMILKLSETAAEDHTAYECAQGIRRALNRWRSQTEDPRLVFLEATIQRWGWVDEMTQLPQSLPQEIRGELVHAIRAGDLEECVLALGTYASKQPDEMKKWRPIFVKSAPKIWAELKPHLSEDAKSNRASALEKDQSKGKKGKTKVVSTSKSRRRHVKGGYSEQKIPMWAWITVLVGGFFGVFFLVVNVAVETEAYDDDLQVAADAVCKAVGGNKPACKAGRRVMRALRDDDCDSLSEGLIQDFSSSIEAARSLRGAVSSGGGDVGNLTGHRDYIVEVFYSLCGGGAE